MQRPPRPFSSTKAVSHDLLEPQRSGWDRRDLATSICLTILVWAVGASRWIATDTVVPWDSKNQFYAFFRFLCASLHGGNWPFWNPYHYGGHPSVADPQSLIFAPIFMAWGAMDPAPSMQAFDLIVSAHLLAGGIAMVLMGCRTGWPMPACVLAAALFMFGGAAAGRLQHTGIILSYSLFPSALLLLQVALGRRSHLAAIGFAVVAASLALGRNQVALLLCALLLAIAASEILGAPRPLQYLRQRWGILATMAVLGCALLVVPMLLTLQFADLSNRPMEVLDDALKGSLHPVNLATFAVADIFGTHGPYWGPGAATSADVALTDDSFNHLFFGTVPLLLLVIGVASGGLWRSGRRLMTGTLVLATLFMLGRYTPVYAVAFEHIPGIGLFRRPTDASFVFGIAVAMLAGHGLADYARDGVLARKPWRIVGAVAGILAIIGAAIVFSAQTGHGAEAARTAALSCATAIVAIVILVVGARRRARGVAACLVTAIAISELLSWNVCFRLNAEARSHYAVLEAPTGADAAAISVLENALLDDHRRATHPRVEVLGLGGAWQNLAMVRRWEAINGYNPLRIGAYDRLVAPGEENWNAAQRRFPPSFAGYNSPLAQTLGLRYLILGQPLASIPGLAAPPVADVLLTGPPIWIYRLRDANPRAEIREGPDADYVAEPADQEMPKANVSVVVSVPGRTEIVVSSDKGGRLVLHDLFYPGWAARIDDQTVPILRIGSLFRGVNVPAGAHRIVFQFLPFSLSNLKNAMKTIFLGAD